MKINKTFFLATFAVCFSSLNGLAENFNPSYLADTKKFPNVQAILKENTKGAVKDGELVRLRGRIQGRVMTTYRGKTSWLKSKYWFQGEKAGVVVVEIDPERFPLGTPITEKTTIEIYGVTDVSYKYNTVEIEVFALRAL